MRIKISLFVAVAVIFFSLPTKAQYLFYDGTYYEDDWIYEGGVTLGGMNALTDIGGRRGPGKRFVRDFNLKTTHFTGGLFGMALFRNMLGFRLEVNYGKVSAYDSILRKVAATTQGRYERNLEFRSNIFEVNGLVEFHPVETFGDFNAIDKFPPQVSPYVVLGLGFYHYEPKATLDGKLIALRPLHTEGQGFEEYPKVKEYKLNQVSIPFGFGARYDITPLINLRVEFLSRFLFTDYLDDVSGKYIDPVYFSKYLSGEDLTNAYRLNKRNIPSSDPDFYSTAHPGGIRGNPKDNDHYMSLTLKLGITLGRQSIFGR